MTDHICEVCGADTSKDPGRCTNRRCSSCHRQHCTPGGETSPGHNRRWPVDHAESTQAISTLYKRALRTGNLVTEALCQMALGLEVLGEKPRAALAESGFAQLTQQQARVEALRRFHGDSR